MGNFGKSFSLFLILLLAISSLIMAKPAFSQIPIPTPSFTCSPPSVPVYTVQIVGPPYIQPTTYSLNSSSGQVVANIGYTNEYSYVVVTIKNQPFTPFNDPQGNPIGFYYNVQIKNHNTTDDWLLVYPAYNGYPTQSTDSDYTNLSIAVASLAGTQTDIQVDANIGYIGREVLGATNVPYVFVGLTSGWSNTQTVTIPANIPLSPTPAPSSSTSTPTPTPTIPADIGSAAQFFSFTNNCYSSCSNSSPIGYHYFSTNLFEKTKAH